MRAALLPLPPLQSNRLDQVDRAASDVDRLHLGGDLLAALVALATGLRQEAPRADREVDDNDVVAHLDDGTRHLGARNHADQTETALAQTHFLLVTVDVDDDELELVAELQRRQTRVTDRAVLTVHLADVHEARRHTEVDEGADVLRAADGALDESADLQRVEERRLLAGDQAEAQTLFLQVDADDLHGELLLVAQPIDERLALLGLGAGHLAYVQQTEADSADGHEGAEVLLELHRRLDGVAQVEGLQVGHLRRIRLGGGDDDRLERDDRDGNDGGCDLDGTRLGRLGAGGALARLELDAGTPGTGELQDRFREFVDGLFALDRGLDDLGGDGDGDDGLGAGGVDDGDGDLGALGEIAERGVTELRDGQEGGSAVDVDGGAVLVLARDDTGDGGAFDERAGGADGIVHVQGSLRVGGFVAG